MNRRPRNLTTSLSLIYAVAIAIASLGCQQASSPSAQAEPERPGPQKSFDEVVQIFKDGIDVAGGSASGFVAQTHGTSARFQVHNTVTSKLIPPTKPEDPYRGTITVSSQSIYSLRQTPKEDAQPENNKQSAANGTGANDFEDAASAGSEIESFEPGLVAAPSSDKKPEGDEATSVQRRPDKVDREYELTYKEGRWELLTKLDPKTEGAIQNAFDRALRLQP